MSRSLIARIERLEKSRAANIKKVIYVIPTRFPMRVEVVEGVSYLRPGLTPAEFAEMAAKQQRGLIKRLKELTDMLPDDPDPLHVGMSKNEKAAPLKPGVLRKPPARYRFEKVRIKGKLVEFQIDTHTNERTQLK